MSSARAERILAELERLRDAFDRSIAAPPEHRTPVEQVDLVVCSVGSGVVAIRVADLRGVHPADALVPLVGRSPGFLGLLGVAAEAVAVHDLARLMRGSGEARWVAVLRGPEGIGLGISSVDGIVRIPADQVRAVAEGPSAVCTAVLGPAAKEHTGCPVLDAAAVRAALEVPVGE